MHSMDLLDKEGGAIGYADSVRMVEDVGLTLPSGSRVFPVLLFSPTLTLEPMQAFTHMSGVALSGILGGSTARLSRDMREYFYGGLVYIHGRSEVLRGDPLVSSVLLAYLSDSTPLLRNPGVLPALYEEFLRLG
jgi:hypothetical protein